MSEEPGDVEECLVLLKDGAATVQGQFPEAEGVREGVGICDF